jgi:hypothetical protein
MARRKDENQTAFSALEELIRRDDIRDGIEVPPIQPEEKDEKAARAGSKGGKMRSKSLSAKKRIAIARSAAKTRWSNKS